VVQTSPIRWQSVQPFGHLRPSTLDPRIAGAGGSFHRIDSYEQGDAMFATIKSLIPEPRQANQPRNYVGRHRQPEPVPPVPAPTSPATPIEPSDDAA
jgi:hypothetical protein